MPKFEFTRDLEIHGCMTEHQTIEADTLELAKKSLKREGWVSHNGPAFSYAEAVERWEASVNDPELIRYNDSCWYIWFRDV